MLNPDLYNRVLEEVECFKSEYKEVQVTPEVIRDYLKTTDFNAQQKAVFRKLVGI